MTSLNTLCSALALSSSSSSSHNSPSILPSTSQRTPYVSSARVKRRLPIPTKTFQHKKSKLTEIPTPDFSPQSPQLSEISDNSMVWELEQKLADETNEETISTRENPNVTNLQKPKTSPSNTKASQSQLDRLTYEEWLKAKREQYKRKRNLLVDQKYKILIQILKQTKVNHLDNTNPDLKWARPLLHATGFELVKVLNDQGSGIIVERLAQPRFQLRFHEIIQECQRQRGLPPGLLTVPILREYYMDVPRFSEIESIIKRYHLGFAHAAPRDMYEKLKTKFVYITREMCKEFKKRCDICSRKAAIIRKAQPPLMQ